MTDYDFTPEPSESELAEPHATLVKAGRDRRVLSLETGRMDQILTVAAVAQADFQARVGQIGHQNWDRRSNLLFDALPEFTNFREVCAVSWAWETEAVQGAESIFKAWEQSSGHWRWVNGRCSIWGYGMAFNAKQNLWYGTGIFGDRR